MLLRMTLIDETDDANKKSEVRRPCMVELTAISYMCPSSATEDAAHHGRTMIFLNGGHKLVVAESMDAIRSTIAGIDLKLNPAKVM